MLMLGMPLWLDDVTLHPDLLVGVMKRVRRRSDRGDRRVHLTLRECMFFVVSEILSWFSVQVLDLHHQSQISRCHCRREQHRMQIVNSLATSQ